jgi:hypothetical protein
MSEDGDTHIGKVSETMLVEYDNARHGLGIAANAQTVAKVNYHSV